MKLYERKWVNWLSISQRPLCNLEYKVFVFRIALMDTISQPFYGNEVTMSSTQMDIRALINTLRRRQNGRHFADDIFKCIFFNENVWILIKISLKFVPKGPINNIPALVQIMAWRRPGNKPLSEPIMVRLPMHISVTRLQWVIYFHG